MGERDACITMPSARRIGSSDKTNACFRCLKATPAGFPLPPRNSWQGDAILPLCEPGDRAMWIVMYVAMIASLSAMGMLPVAEYRDQLPHDHA
jgi:hypothetical protein